MRDEAVARHMQLIAELSREGRPLSADGATATMSNPAWFRADGRPRQARDQLHEALLQGVLVVQEAAAAARDGASAGDGPDEDQPPRAVVMAGPPGAGKSTVRAQIMGSDISGYEVIDADAFKDGLIDAALADGSYEAWIKPARLRELEAAGERFFPLEMSALLQKESSLLAVEQRTRAMDEGRNVVVDSVLWKQSDALALGEALKGHGYEVSVIDVEVGYDLSKARIAARWEEVYRAALAGQAPRGGRWVPSEYARKVYAGPAGIHGASLCEPTARALAEQCDAVVDYRLFRAVPAVGASGQDYLATAAVLVEHRRRERPGAALVSVLSEATVGPGPAASASPRAPRLDRVPRALHGRGQERETSAGRADGAEEIQRRRRREGQGPQGPTRG